MIPFVRRAVTLHILCCNIVQLSGRGCSPHTMSRLWGNPLILILSLLDFPLLFSTLARKENSAPPPQCNILVPVDTIELLVSPEVARM